MSTLYCQCPTLYQAGAGNIVGATSVTLTSLQDIYGNVLTMADFGALGYFTLEPDTVNAEGATFTGVTANANGTYTLTGVKTVLAKSPYTQTSGLVRQHSGGTKVVITDSVAFWDTFVNKNNIATITAVHTFATGATPVITDAPVNPTDAANKGYADSLAIAGSPDSSTATKGIGKVSVAPVSATSPIFVGDNDGRVPTQGENDALVGNNTDIAVGTGNKFITQTGLQHNAEKYAADAGANDTYVITLSPVPTSYTNGMVVYFKANTANTGAATLNVNSLGAITIVKSVSTTLADGDIAAGMFCTVIYNGTNFVLQNPTANVSTYKNGVTTRDASTASGTQTIAHGLGTIPKYVRLSAYFNWAQTATTSYFSSSIGSYNGTTNSCVFTYNTFAQSGGNTTVSSTSGTQAIYIQESGTSGTQTGIVTVDSTNITITWTKTGTVDSTNINILWEANS